MLTAPRHCPSCDEEREFQQPPCVDGHGPDCPEWACVECGLAVMVEFDLDLDSMSEAAYMVEWAA